MSDRIARLAVVLGLTPLAVGIAILFFRILLEFESSLPKLPAAMTGDWLAVILAATSGIVILVVIGLWRNYVRWTLGRWCKTLGLTLLLFGQLWVWQPIVSVSGCGEKENLIASQSVVTVAMWIVGCAVSWWGLALFRGARHVPPISRGRMPMPLDVARMAMGLGLIPLVFGAFWMSSVLENAERRVSGPLESLISLEVCAILTVSLWFFAWRRRVQWTRRKLGWTLGLALTLLAVPWVVLLFRWTFPSERSAESISYTLIQTLPFFAAALWFIGTAWLWRRTDEITITRGELGDGVLCPQCNYNLNGLKEVKCPECGWTSTVDQLVRIAFENASIV